MQNYLSIRETIHGLDRLIVTVIYQGVTIITGCLTLGMLFFEKIGNPLHAEMNVMSKFEEQFKDVENMKEFALAKCSSELREIGLQIFLSTASENNRKLQNR